MTGLLLLSCVRALSSKHLPRPRVQAHILTRIDGSGKSAAGTACDCEPSALPTIKDRVWRLSLFKFPDDFESIHKYGQAPRGPRSGGSLPPLPSGQRVEL